MSALPPVFIAHGQSEKESLLLVLYIPFALSLHYRHMVSMLTQSFIVVFYIQMGKAIVLANDFHIMRVTLSILHYLV